MTKKNFGFMQGRMTLPPSKKILQYYPKKNWKREFYYAKKYNFNFIEYIFDGKFNKNNPIFNHKNLKLINTLVKKNNLVNYSFCDNYFIKKNLINYKDLNIYFSCLVKNLSFINIKIYVLALFDKSYIDKNNLKNFVNKLQIISDYLKSQKIKLALETDLDIESIKKLIKLINRKNVFIVYDTGNNLKKQKSQFDEILKLKKYICHFHLKDKNFKGENVVLGTGKVNFDLIFKAIRTINYKGRYTFETNRGDNPIKTMIYNKNFVLEKIRKFKY